MQNNKIKWHIGLKLFSYPTSTPTASRFTSTKELFYHNYKNIQFYTQKIGKATFDNLF